MTLVEDDRLESAALRAVRPDSKHRRSGRRREAECGTESGYTRHRRTDGTEPCDECKAAHTEACRAREVAAGRRSGRRRGPLAPCGSSGAYQRHLKRGEKLCDLCAAFMRESNREQSRRIFADPKRRERRARLGRERRYAKTDAPSRYAPYVTAVELCQTTGVQLVELVQWEDAWLEACAEGHAPDTLTRRLYDQATVDMVKEIVDLRHRHGFTAEAALIYLTEDVTVEEAAKMARAESEARVA